MMFGLFKKKAEKPQPDPVAPQETSLDSVDDGLEQRKAFLAQFTGEETDILGIVGPSGVEYEKVEGTALWHVTITLTAWIDEYQQQLQQQDARLEAMVDDTLLDYLRSRTPRNFIVAATVRPAQEEGRFLMTDLPKPGFDPELKALLEEQNKPVTLEVDSLGTFTLNRMLGWYDATILWMDNEISLNLDQAEEHLAAAQETAKTLVADQANWDARIRAFAARQLLPRIHQLQQECDEPGEPFTPETLADLFELDSILAGPDDAFEFWLCNGDLLLGHPIHVAGTLADGPLLAEMDD